MHKPKSRIMLGWREMSGEKGRHKEEGKKRRKGYDSVPQDGPQ